MGGHGIDVVGAVRRRTRSDPGRRLPRGARGRGACPPEITLAAREAAPERGRAAAGQAARARIEDIIMAPHLATGLQWLHDAGALAVVLPELDATVDFSQEAGRRHKDVWEHTKQVVRQSPDKAAGPLVGAAARHRQGAHPGAAARRAGDVSPPRRGGRAHVRRHRPAAAVRPRGAASASASSSITTCAPTPTSAAGPIRPCAASITRWAATSTTWSSCRWPT